MTTLEFYVVYLSVAWRYAIHMRVEQHPDVEIGIAEPLDSLVHIADGAQCNLCGG